MEQTIQQYLKGLEQAQLRPLLVLFAPEAVVYSPLYGKMDAIAFYTDLFKDSQQSVIRHYHTFTDVKAKMANVFFNYQWTMANGQLTSFDCVDVFTFDEAGLITELRIIYDTAATRPMFNTMKSF